MGELGHLEARAALFGITVRGYVQLAQELASDPRILADAAIATPEAVRRLQAWDGAGRPDAAPGALSFRGHDSVRAIVIATLTGLPVPVRWHAVRHVSWFEIGRGRPAAYMTDLEPTRALGGDIPHVIVIDGRQPDELLPAICAHEIAHAVQRGWHKPATTPDEEAPAWTEFERDARLLAAFDQDRDAAARLLFRGEHIANEAARLWGYPCTGLCPDAERLQLFRERMDAAAELAANIGRQIDEQIEAKRAAAIVATDTGA